ncbi:pseudouridine-5'-phosphate glycosidase [Sporodiniella umbellata]|nr:pseudouridine-5'-phosphate glycosidase [Sporodiniella umbellata]
MLCRLGVRAFHAFSVSEKFVITPEIKEALKKKGPVVALESTIISHGMPYPQNVKTARSVEKIIREQGAIPATIAVLDGKVHIELTIALGLTEENLEYLGKTGREAIKASRRDLPMVLSQKKTGATTVASTMVLARAAGIPIFVTGGIGGAHRGSSDTFDISADLSELGRTSVAVICAGVKSILDIPKTLEVLETEGVTVSTVGKTKQFPAFYVPDSGLQSPYNVESTMEAAKAILANHDLNLDSGMVFAVPIPKESAANAKAIQEAIDQAFSEARTVGITGKEETPFLLKRVSEITKGESLAANIALVKNNAKIGGQIAVLLSELKQRQQSKSS